MCDGGAGVRSQNTPTMNLLQIVHLETNDAEAELVHTELQSGGIACELRRVRDQSELISELARRPADIILSDRSEAENDGLRTITIGRTQTPEVPVIFVADAIDTTAITQVLQAGATDFFLKGRLPQPVPSILGALLQAGTQRGFGK